MQVFSYYFSCYYNILNQANTVFLFCIINTTTNIIKQPILPMVQNNQIYY